MDEQFYFLTGPWENSRLPTIIRENPTGGDPIILAVIKRIHNPEALHELCRLANEAIAKATPSPETGEPTAPVTPKKSV